MLVRQRRQVERFGAHRHEGLAPDQGHQHRGDEFQRECARITPPDLAAGLGGADRFGEGAQDGRHQVVVPDAGQGREVAGLGDHHLHDAAQRQGFHQVADPARDQPQQVRQRPRMSRDERTDGLHVGRDGLGHYGAEHVLNGFEIEGERALGDARAPRDYIELGGREPALGEDRHGRLDDLARPVGLAAAEFRLAGFEHRSPRTNN